MNGSLKLCLVTVCLAFASTASAGVIFLFGDSNIGTFTGGPLANPGNIQFFKNVLGTGTKVLIHDDFVGVSFDRVSALYNSLPGVTSTFDDTAPEITAAALFGVDLYISVLPSDPYTAAELSALGSFIANSGRVFFAGDNSLLFDEIVRINEALGTLGSTMRLGFGGIDAFNHVTTNIDSDPFTAGVSSISYVATTFTTGGTSLVRTRTQSGARTFVAYEAFPDAPTASVPEPATMTLLGLGLVGVALRAVPGRRRKKDGFLSATCRACCRWRERRYFNRRQLATSALFTRSTNMQHMTMRQFTRAVPLAALCLLLWSGSARAGIIYSNLGPGDSFDFSANTLSGPLASFEQNVAMSFTLSGTSAVAFQSAELPLFSFGAGGTITLLLTDDAGGVPGATIESFSLFVPNTIPQLYTLSSTLHPTLNPGQTYWLAAVATGDFEGGWFFNDQGYSGAQALSFGGPWVGFPPDPSFPDSAFRIAADEVAALPEPCSALLLGIGTVGAAWCRRRPRKHAEPALARSAPHR